MMETPTIREAVRLASVTTRIQNWLTLNYPDRATTTFALTEGCDLSFSDLTVSPLYRIVVVKNDFIGRVPSRRTDPEGYREVMTVRRMLEVLARRCHLSFELLNR